MNSYAYLRFLALLMQTLSEENPPSLVIAADTILLSGNTIIEKPMNPKQHFNMLRHLRDKKSHKVFTGVACIAPLDVPVHPGYCIRTCVEETTVFFGHPEVVTDEVLMAYVQSGEGTDAAGGYKIQEGGGVLIEKIVGDYSNVVGLPIHSVYPHGPSNEALQIDQSNITSRRTRRT
jgi:septum formation protein